MSMDQYDTLVTVSSIVFTLTAFLALIYSCLILFNRRFHHANNIFILNICINIITCCVYFTTYFQVRFWNMSIPVCVIFLYCFNIASMQIPFAFLTFTLHRFFSILYYTNGFFKTKRWISLCISIQWISQFIISLARPLGEYTVIYIYIHFFLV